MGASAPSTHRNATCRRRARGASVCVCVGVALTSEPASLERFALFHSIDLADAFLLSRGSAH